MYTIIKFVCGKLEELLVKPDLQPLHELGDFANQSLIDELCKVIG